MAKLYYRFGSMGSSKTANALMVKFNYEELGQKVLLLRPSIDTRDSKGVITSRIGLSSEVFDIEEDENIYETLVHTLSHKNSLYYHCIIVDEAQFLTREHVVQLSNIVDRLNIPVICYGLRADFQGNLFPGSAALMALADTIEEIKTICWCGKKAIMNARISDGKVIYEGPQVLIGSNKNYISLCRKHWKEGKYHE